MSVRVRFAPSPTGYLHVGNIRAALTNWLFARRVGGVFILRLDDTDPERSKEEFAEAIKEDLTWLGLDWGETYKQSERLKGYEAAAEALKKAGRLYPCFETSEELEVKRKMQLARKLPPVYDRAGLKLSEAEKAKFEAEGRTPHWRFKLDEAETVEFNDLIRGSSHFEMSAVSDPVLIRHDGSFLYTLPSVVDDMEMNITHIVRGEDHVTNSAVQTQIFGALGGKTPTFAHFSLLQSITKEGLSKRTGALSIRQLRGDGIEPEAILSLLAHIGTSDDIKPYADVAPLIESFDFSKFGRATAKFDVEELKSLNAKIIHNLPYGVVKARMGAFGVGEAEWEVIKHNIATLIEAEDWHHMIEGPVTPVIEGAGFIAEALAVFPKGKLDEGSWSSWAADIKEKTGRKGRDLFMPLRLALTGRDHGPEMKLLLPLIGAERAKARLRGKSA
ncbi:MAG: glutamate--tRNA ligase [Sphingomonadales bacterium]